MGPATNWGKKDTNAANETKSFVGFNFPLKMISSEMPIGFTYKAGVSAHLKSAVILAGLNSYGDTKIVEIKKSRDHTENMLLKNTNTIKITNGKKKLYK